MSDIIVAVGYMLVVSVLCRLYSTFALRCCETETSEPHNFDFEFRDAVSNIDVPDSVRITLCDARGVLKM